MKIKRCPNSGHTPRGETDHIINDSLSRCSPDRSFIYTCKLVLRILASLQLRTVTWETHGVEISGVRAVNEDTLVASAETGDEVTDVACIATEVGVQLT